MNAITTAIEVFESKIIEIRLAFKATPKSSLKVMLEAFELRDAELEKCLWAIELLHAAHTYDKKATASEVKEKEFTNIF